MIDSDRDVKEHPFLYLMYECLFVSILKILTLVLQIRYTMDDALVRKEGRKLSLFVHPDKATTCQAAREDESMVEVLREFVQVCVRYCLPI